MTIDRRNNILSVVLAIIILILAWFLVRSIVVPYERVEAREAMTEHVQARMLDIRDALIRFEQEFDHFPPTEGGLDSLMNFIRTDSLMQIIADSIFYNEEYGLALDSLIYSPRPPHKRFVYAKTDSLIREIYVLKDPDSDLKIGSLTNTTLINTPNF